MIILAILLVEALCYSLLAAILLTAALLENRR